MTIRMIMPWHIYTDLDKTYTLGSTEEARLVALGLATYDLDGDLDDMESRTTRHAAEHAAMGVPANYIYTKYPLPVIEKFNYFSDWTATNGGSGVSTSSVGDGYLADNCINMATPAVAGSSTYVTQDQTIDMSAQNGFWLLMRNRYRTLNAGVGLTMYLANGAGMTVGGGGRYTLASIPYAGAVSVQPHWVPKTSWGTLDGTPTFASPILSWRFRLDSVATDARDVDLLGVVMKGARPTIIFTFDDGWDTSYSVGFANARKREIPLTHYLIGSLLDRTDLNYITTAQAIEMASVGDYLGLHGASAWDVDLSLPEADKAALVAKLGSTYSTFEHAAYPEGKIGNGELWQSMEATLSSLGVETGRLAGVTGEPTLLGYSDPYCLTAYPLNNTTSLVQAKAAVDLAISSGGTVIFYGHKLAGAADAVTWVTSDWTGLLDYVAAYRDSGMVDCKTIKDWYDQGKSL